MRQALFVFVFCFYYCIVLSLFNIVLLKLYQMVHISKWCGVKEALII